jgi:hypothetical protein
MTVVKKLKWTKGVVDIAQPMPGMKYVACSTTPKGSWAFWLDHAPETHSVFTSEEAAKAAAQADYSARILSALEPSAARPCTCHPDDNPPVPCAGKYALSDCQSAAREELMKQIREGTAHGFLNDGSQLEGNPDLDCPYCCGSGHNGDVQPSAARELALVDALEVAKNELQAWIKCADENGLCVTSTPHVIDHIDIALASLSSPGHADAGKLVEGDGWMPIESAPNNNAILVHYDDGNIELISADDNMFSWIAYTVKEDFCTKPTHWRPLPLPPVEGGKND